MSPELAASRVAQQAQRIKNLQEQLAASNAEIAATEAAKLEEENEHQIQMLPLLARHAELETAKELWDAKTQPVHEVMRCDICQVCLQHLVIALGMLKSSLSRKP